MADSVKLKYYYFVNAVYNSHLNLGTNQKPLKSLAEYHVTTIVTILLNALTTKVVFPNSLNQSTFISRF